MGRFFQPDSGFFFIFLQADTIEQGQSGDGLCLDVAISGGYPVPAHGFPVAFGGSPAVRIAVGQPVLGFRYITPGGLQEPVESLFRVFEGAFAGQIHQAEKVLGKRVTVFGGFFVTETGGAPVFFAGQPGQIECAGEGGDQGVAGLFRYGLPVFRFPSGQITQAFTGCDGRTGKRNGGGNMRVRIFSGGQKRYGQKKGRQQTTENRHDVSCAMRYPYRMPEVRS